MLDQGAKDVNTEIEIQNEPYVDDLLEDPILHAVLVRDGLTVEDVRAVIAEYRRQIGERQSLTH